MKYHLLNPTSVLLRKPSYTKQSDKLSITDEGTRDGEEQRVKERTGRLLEYRKSNINMSNISGSGEYMLDITITETKDGSNSDH